MTRETAPSGERPESVLAAHFHELAPVPAALPFDLFKPLSTIEAHCTVLMDGDQDPRDIAYCIKAELADIVAFFRKRLP